ncbi:unnamed protein product [Arctia plantaginis]|uniref:Uncharacterized protein n=1 Tax=Arctia plantaginis TaxID=874455 RepID=A0A8S1BBN6_ARCPL|nr:unnamed protein product [Arctia plantaginis]
MTGHGRGATRGTRVLADALRKALTALGCEWRAEPIGPPRPGAVWPGARVQAAPEPNRTSTSSLLAYIPEMHGPAVDLPLASAQQK